MPSHFITLYMKLKKMSPPFEDNNLTAQGLHTYSQPTSSVEVEEGRSTPNKP
jgi:hypothetical protein